MARRVVDKYVMDGCPAGEETATRCQIGGVEKPEVIVDASCFARIAKGVVWVGINGVQAEQVVTSLCVVTVAPGTFNNGVAQGKKRIYTVMGLVVHEALASPGEAVSSDKRVDCVSCVAARALYIRIQAEHHSSPLSSANDEKAG